MSDSLWPHGLQHTRPPCPSPTPGVYSNSCPLSQWFQPTVSSSVIRPPPRPPGARLCAPGRPESPTIKATKTNKQTKKKNGRLSGSKETNIPERDSLAPSHLRGVHPSSEGTKYLLNKTNISCAYQSSGLCAICTHICLINTWLLDPKRITSQYYKQYITLRNLVPIFQDLLAKKRKTQGKSLQPNHSVFSAERLSSCDWLMAPFSKITLKEL